ncbi:MAG: YfhO family protein [Flavobacteriaceae bacterium]|nr:YfhO family protein [Flavobacteriaceae bacterium]
MINGKKTIPYLIAILIFIVASLAYFSPVLKGKKIQQSDITQYIGSSKEIKDFRKDYDAEPYWTNTSFGGMPAYVISAYYPHDYIKKLDRLIRFLPRPADYLFLYFIGFFVLLMTLKVDWKLAIIGALGFGFSTYLISLFGAGHNGKAHAIAYMPLVISGILLVFQRKYLFGFILTALAMSLELAANHVQMTYYLFFLILIFGIVQLIESIKNKELPHFAKSIGVLLVAVILAIGTNATNLLATQEYAKHSTRSKSELTITPDGKEREATSGLDKDYITQYSYGKLETFNLFIPRFVGGTSHEEVKDSEVRNFLQDAVNDGLNPDDANYLLNIASMYWGAQPFVAAPAYIGAIFIFLFVLALFLVKGNLKKWLVAATIFSILMSWGKNFGFLTDFFIDYVPLYNKFRAVSSIQVIAELCIPLLGILGLKELFSSDVSKDLKINALKWTTIIVGGLALLFTVGGTGLFTFETPVDVQIDEQVSGFLEAVVADRQTLFFGDSLRTLSLVLAFAGILLLFLKEKITQTIVLIGFAVLLLFDLVNVDKRYVNNDYFTSARKVKKPFKKSSIDAEILKDKSYYRVADFTKSIFNDASTSYFHKSIGGYSAVKPKRYQELFDFHVDVRNKNINPEVLNMLNTKYIVNINGKGERALQKNRNANGNAWFVQKLKVVKSANEEIKALDSIDTKSTAIIRNKLLGNLSKQFEIDSLATIKLTDYKANALTYESSANTNQFAVFSDMYYKDGWNAYIDGIKTPIYKVNYVLRAISIPKGTHKIEFNFEPKVIKKGNTITLISYGLLLLISVGWFFVERRK